MVPSPIEWLWHWVHGWLVPGFTFNPWIGCEKVSAGCKNCYASVDTYARVSKSRGLPLWGPGSLRLAKKARELSRIVGFEVRPRVFPSLCDPFEDRVDLLAPRAKFFELIEKTPELDWLVLTKRPANVLGMVPHMSWYGTNDFARTHCRFPSNFWLGTSVEDQEAADKRIPELFKVPAKVRFLSCEPLLGPVLLDNGVSSYLSCHGEPAEECCGAMSHHGHHFHGIDWVIVGGESGTNARPMHPDWVRGIQKQCEAARVPCFVKQMGSNPTGLSLRDKKGGDVLEWPADLRVQEGPHGRA